MQIILENILFFVAILLVVFLYGYIIKVIYLYIKQIFKSRQFIPQKTIFNIKPNTKLKKLLLIVFIMINLSMYFSNKNKWINEETSNHNAKEYLVTYLNLHFYRVVLNNFIKIDSLLFFPMNALTKFIHDKAVLHLPRGDGEIAFYYYYFNAYFYVRRGGYLPEKNRENEPRPVSKKQVALLDRLYLTSKILATRPIKDKKIFLEKYKVLPTITNFYIFNMYSYFGNYVGNRAEKGRKDKYFMKKLNDILQWNILFQNEYKNYEDLKETIEKENPILGVAYYYNIRSITSDFIYKAYEEKNMKCNSDYIKTYVTIGEMALKKDSPLNVINKQQKDIFINLMFHSHFTKSVTFIINDRCNIKEKYGYPSDKWIKKHVNYVN